LLEEIKQYITAIIAASQDNVPVDIENMTIEEMLAKYSVGTDRAKAPPPPPKDLSLLGPLREQDFRSVHKQMSDRLNHINNDNVSTNNNEHNETIEINSPMTYRKIVKLIIAIYKVLPNDNDIEDLEKFVGYRILEQRASPINFKYMGNVSRQIIEIKRLISLANADYRERKKVQQQKRSRKRQNQTYENVNNEVENDNENNIVEINDNVPLVVDDNSC
jgi:hypothetical protein